MIALTRILYRVVDGPVLDAIVQWKCASETAAAKRTAMIREFKAEGVYSNSRAIVGFVWNDPALVPPSFRHYSGDPKAVYRPNRKTKEGKEIARQLCISYPEYQNFDKAIGGPGGVFGFNDHGQSVMMWCSFEELNGVYVVSIPSSTKSDSFVPAGCVELKGSEYLQLKADEAKAREFAASVSPKEAA